MNTGHKPTKVIQCERCPDVYMTVGDTVVGLAFPRPVSRNARGNLYGVCPKHRKKIGE